MRRFRCGLVAISFLASPVAALADDAKPAPEIPYWERRDGLIPLEVCALHDGAERIVSRESRQVVGAEFVRQLSVLVASIPKSTPAEDEAFESDSRSRDRQLRYFSRPVLLHRLRQSLEEQLGLARCTVEDPSREIACFLQLARRLILGFGYQEFGTLVEADQLTPPDVHISNLQLGAARARDINDLQEIPRAVGVGVLSCIVLPWVESNELRATVQ